MIKDITSTAVSNKDDKTSTSVSTPVAVIGDGPRSKKKPRYEELVQPSSNVMRDIVDEQRKKLNHPKSLLQRMMFWKKKTTLDDYDVAPEWFMNFKDIVEANGFEFEEYEVITEDGYVNTLHRLYLKDEDTDKASKPKKALYL